MGCTRDCAIPCSRLISPSTYEQDRIVHCRFESCHHPPRRQLTIKGRKIMSVFYQCDFCESKKFLRLNEGSKKKIVIANTRPDSSVICADCVRLAFEIVSDKTKDNKE